MSSGVGGSTSQEQGEENGAVSGHRGEAARPLAHCHTKTWACPPLHRDSRSLGTKCPATEEWPRPSESKA